MDTTALAEFLCTCLGGYFAIMNPIANTPVFIGLTDGDDAATKKAVARNSILFAFVLIAVLSFIGIFIFKLFGITLPALRITGGIVLFMIGYQMLQGSSSKVHTLRGSKQIVEHLGQNGINVITRFMGLILATIGIGMILAGLDTNVHTLIAAIS